MKKILVISILFACLQIVSAQTYYGEGIYALMPGDEVIFRDEGYIVKYYSFSESAGKYVRGEYITEPTADLLVFNMTANTSFYGDSLYPIYISGEEIKTFYRGIWFYARPLKENSEVVEIELKLGILSGCIDTDAYTVGNTVIGLETGEWGGNYYAKGFATEIKEDKTGQTETKREDSCIDRKLTEYYCKNNELKSEEKRCDCLDEGSCKKTALVKIADWFRELFK